MAKTRVGILFGGRSAEHEVSVQSARNILEALDRRTYEPVLIGIDRTGRWLLSDSRRLLGAGSVTANGTGTEVTLRRHGALGEPGSASEAGELGAVDVVFPVLHGPYGEDGTVQGLLKLADIPFVGAGVLGSAVGMDKDVMKRLLRDAGVPVGDFVTFYRRDDARRAFKAVVERLGLPLFVKPANLGSSVGISKVHTEGEYHSAVDTAFSFDRKILVEEAIRGREVECAVLGGTEPSASVVGEVIPRGAFYSYEAKYVDENGAELHVPADLPNPVAARVRQLALTTFSVLECEMLGRVDFFITQELEVLVNEINTLPGFTRISMYPRLWEASGVSYSELVDRLISMAVSRHREEQALRSDR
jgi:D-alanine-D-alanine ligase